jgi:hypothetical protein
MVDNLKDHLRSLFNPQDPQKKNALPPKAQFSTRYFLMVFLLITLM